MPMRVTCSNCGKQFSAWDDLVGKQVQCPKCQHKMVLGGPNKALEGPAAPPAGKRSPSVRPPGPGGPSSTPAAGQPPRAPAAPVPRTANQVPPAVARPAAAAPLPAIKRTGTAAGARGALPASPPSPTLKSAAPVRRNADLDDGNDRLPLGCPNCNAPMEPNDDLCDSCGYHLILKKVIDISDMKKQSKSTGFERLLEDQFHESETSQSALLWMKLVAGLALVAVLFLCLGKWWWVGVLITGAIIGYFWFAHRQRVARVASGESEVNQDPLSAVVWTGFLSVQRLLGWRKLAWPFAAARALTLRDPQFNDQELEDLDGLGELEALDLEGTGITDEGLEQLRSLKQLQFLVVRGTHVTRAAVSRLQADLPETMIWY